MEGKPSPPPFACGKCGRPIAAGRTWCLYCGWAPEGAGPSHEPPLQREVFRSGSHLAVCVVAALLFGPVAVLLGAYALGRGTSPVDRAGTGALAALALLLGPIPCFVQILRRKFLWVRVEPDQGLVTSGGRLVPWGSIQSVEVRKGALTLLTPSAEELGVLFPRRGLGCAGSHLGCWLLLALLFGCVVFPVLSLLSPWHPRVTVTLSGGERLVYRDLEHDDRFRRIVEKRAREAS